MTPVVIELADLAATERFGRMLAKTLPPGSVIALNGTLGAGKTRLVQAIALALGIDPLEVTSPTFVLCREYHGARTILHLDVYRLRDEDEFLELGPEEMFAGDALVFIEWAERISNFLPPGHIVIALEVTSESSRTATLTAFDLQSAEVVHRISESWHRGD